MALTIAVAQSVNRENLRMARGKIIGFQPLIGCTRHLPLNKNNMDRHHNQSDAIRNFKRSFSQMHLSQKAGTPPHENCKHNKVIVISSTTTQIQSCSASCFMAYQGGRIPRDSANVCIFFDLV